MAESRTGPIHWYSPDPRAIIPLDERFHVSRSLRRLVQREVFDIRYDTSFREVIGQCAVREDTWISGEIIRAYEELFRAGWAHTVECWEGEDLAGGLYGVSIQGAFFGESMFSRRPNASKVALVALVRHLRERNFRLLDTQFLTPHLAQFGACEVTREEYLLLLEEALTVNTRFT